MKNIRKGNHFQDLKRDCQILKKTTENFQFQKRGTIFLLYRRIFLEQTAINMSMLKMLKENQQPWPIIASR